MEAERPATEMVTGGGWGRRRRETHARRDLATGILYSSYGLEYFFLGRNSDARFTVTLSILLPFPRQQ
jgi:hypothetical protein